MEKDAQKKVIEESCDFSLKLGDWYNKHHSFRRDVRKILKQPNIRTGVDNFGVAADNLHRKCAAYFCLRDAERGHYHCYTCANHVIFKAVVKCIIDGVRADADSIKHYADLTTPIEPFVELTMWILFCAGIQYLDQTSFQRAFSMPFLAVLDYAVVRRTLIAGHTYGPYLVKLVERFRYSYKAPDEFVQGLLTQEAINTILVLAPEESDTGVIDCRLCLCEIEIGDKALVPCKCSGSIKYIHPHCFLAQIVHADDSGLLRKCPVCKQSYDNAYAVTIGDS